LIFFVIYATIQKIGGKTMEKQREKCVLYDRDCIGCLECEICDLDKNKICDNCGKCLDIKDYATIKIDRIITDKKAESN